MKLHISINEFIDVKPNSNHFLELFNIAIRDKKAIDFNFLDEKVELSVVDNCKTIKIVCRKRYVFQKLTDSKLFDYGLFLPFLINFSSVTIGHQFLFYYPNDHRSILNVLSRNLSIGFLTKFNELQLLTDNKHSSQNNQLISETISKNIFWEFKNVFKVFPNIQGIDFYTFKYAGLLGGDFFNHHILNETSHAANLCLIADYESDYIKKEVRHLLKLREHIMSFKSKLI